ncbi:ankyrin repeat-containing domain protein, partial [Umbelopsis sp. AD052]
MTALHWAARHGDPDLIHLLLKNITNTEKKNRDGKTALFISTELNHRYAVMALVSHGVFVNCKDQEGMTAVHKAALLGHAEIVSILMEAGATIEGKDDPIAALLDIASGAGHKNVVETILSQVRKSGSPIDYMSSALLNAAECGKVGVVLLLLNCGASIETKDQYGRTPLFLAGKYPDLVATLVDKGSDMEARTLRGYTPIHYYTFRGYFGSLRLLLNLGCNMSSFDYESQTALHHAVKGDNLAITELLVHRGIDLNAWDCKGLTALHIAIQKNNIDIVEAIVQKGIDIDTSDRRIPRSTPLKMAIEYGREEIVQLLINHGANVKCTLGDQTSLPLHLAASRLNPKIVSMILNAGAIPNLEGSDGYSPLQSLIYTLQKKISCEDIANEHSVLEVTNLLLEAGADSRRLHTPRQIKYFYPKVADLLSRHSSIPSQQHYPSGRLPRISSSSHSRSVGPLTEIIPNAETGHISVLNSLIMMDDVMTMYGTGFPSSRELQLDKFKVVKEGESTHDNGFAAMSMGFKITHSSSTDDRAARIIASLIQGISAKFYCNNNVFIVDLPESHNYIAPRWAFNFNSMRG